MFDNQTVAFLTLPGMVAALLAQLVNWWSNRDTPGVKWWAIGMVLETIGVIIRAQPSFLPEWATVPIVNLLVVGGQYVVLYGLCRFAGRPMFVRTAVSALAAVPLAQFYFVAVEDDIVVRTLIMCAGLGLAFALQVSILWSMGRREGMGGVVMLLIAYALTFGGFVLRSIVLVWKGTAPVGMLHVGDSMAISSPQSLASTALVAVTTAYTYGFIMLVANHSRWQLRQVAIVDSLTGVSNRRAFDTELQHMMLRARRSQGRLGLMLMDLDHFKRVNDVHGHAAGDAFLRHFAGVVRHTLRETDFFARVGGEEFALLLGDANLDALQLAAERIRGALEESPLALANGNAIRTTVSIGIATSEAGGGDVEALYRAADVALYRAKTLGRNRVELDAPPAPSAVPAAANDSAATAAPPPAPAAEPVAPAKPFIFTIGHAGEYDAALARSQATPITKRGPYRQADGSQYYGGYAFETVQHAYAYIDKLGKRGEWAAYEVEAVWPEDIWHPHAVEDFMRLNRDAVLRRKVVADEVSEPVAAVSGQAPA